MGAEPGSLAPGDDGKFTDFAFKWGLRLRETLMRAHVLIVTLAALSASGVASATNQPYAYEYFGIASALDGGAELYREHHHVERDAAGRGTRVVLYACPDGRPYARKLVSYAGWEGAPDFEMLDARDGWLERVERDGDVRRVTVREQADSPERVAKLDAPEGLVVDAGFDDFVRANWARLAAGERIDFAFLVPSRLDVMRFKVKRQASATIDGEPATVVRLGLGAWYSFLLPHIDVTYRDASQRLAVFEGLTNQRSPGGSHLMARIDFPAEARRALSSGALEAAKTVPLDGRCELH